ncbi:anaerobic ribonucleoside-triphosphate reductase activating protein [Thalassotalea litorea]|uniref:Anaerobic ribonucleoside-triphosphate reductase activating protein n=1 Tax=Thalassotalea litorea TaxID=2020715 RepID=A0A5R9IT95_9GAMM|nr:anaerobic ribonucleoside-triphosphate reductase activating protein [Thalassotalea litorea]TLU66416.1 anaerobic ribonucleoside-triphosphate reductase activating protein [Thalassotalea litorea]
MLRYLPPQVVFQEVPDQVSLAFVITGCPLRCSGCHSKHTWSASYGNQLSNSQFSHYLSQYQSLITCVVFFGGEWHLNALIEKLKIAHQYQLKTCLYTGLEQVSDKLIKHLDFLKTGPWRADVGGLDNPGTNQRFIDVKTKQCLNHLFR